MRKAFLAAALLLLPALVSAQGFFNYVPPASGAGGGGGDLLDGTLCPDSNGFLVRTSSGNCAIRGITNSDGYIICTNCDGVSGDPIIDFDSTNIIPFSSGSADPPATCTSPALYHETDQFDLFFCETTNQWTLLVSNTSVTDDGALVSNGTTYQRKTLTNGPLSYSTSSNAFSQAPGIISHATDCTAVTTGITNDICVELDSENLYTCQPSAGGCDTAGEWILSPAAAASAFDPATTLDVYEEFMGGNVTSGAVGTLGWTTSTGSGAAITVVSATAGLPGQYEISTGSTDNIGLVLSLAPINITDVTSSEWTLYFSLYITTAVTNKAITFGFQGAATGTDLGAMTDAIGFVYDTDLSHSNWIARICDATGAAGCGDAGDDTNQDSVDMGVAVTINTRYTFKIRRVTAGVGGNPTYYFSINGGAEKTFCSSSCDEDLGNLPAATSLRPSVSLHTRTTASKSMTLDWSRLTFTGLTR